MDRRQFLAAVAGALTAAFTKPAIAQGKVAKATTGTLLKVGAADGKFVSIASVQQLSLNMKLELVDVTSHFDSFRHFVPGPVSSELSFSILGAVEQKALAGTLPDIKFKVEAHGTEIEMVGHIKTANVRAEPGHPVQTDIVITVSGPIAFKKIHKNSGVGVSYRGTQVVRTRKG